MLSKTKILSGKAAATVSFLLFCVVRGLAALFPLSGQTMAKIYQSYPNLLSPLQITFGIWAFIYFALGAYTLYQLGFFYEKKDGREETLTGKVNFFFTLSSLLGIAWVFAFQARALFLALLFVIGILFSLVQINKILKKNDLTVTERFFIKLPFGFYLGWMTYATFLLATIYLVSIGFGGFGLPLDFWASAMIALCTLIGIVTMLRFRLSGYSFSLIWSLIGILIRHTAPDGFGGRYPSVVVTVIVSIALLLMAAAFVASRQN
jgi:hypothetical protein